MAGNGQRKKVAVAVLGMHRSGTSFASRLLNLLGYELGKDVAATGPDNETGFWENTAVVAADDGLLATQGLAWDDPRPLVAGWHRGADMADHRRHCLRILADQFDGAQRIVVKDPRMCRLVPFWDDVLVSQAYLPHHLLMFRPAMEVAGSLAKRDAMPESRAILLWLRHVLEAEEATRGGKRAFATYDGMMADWRRSFGSIFAAFDLPAPEPSTETITAIETFRRQDLRHHRSAASSEQVSRTLSPWVAMVEQAIALAVAGREAEALPMFDEVRAEIDHSDRLYVAMIAPHLAANAETQRRKLEAVESKLEAAERSLDLAGRSVDMIQEVAHQAQHQVTEIERLRASSETGRIECYAELVAARESAKLLSDEAVRLAAERSQLEERNRVQGVDLVELAAAKASLSAILVERDAAVARLGTERDAVGEALAALRLDHERLGTERNGVADALAALRLDHARVGTERDAATEALSALRLDHERLGTERDGVADALAALRRDHDRLLSTLAGLQAEQAKLTKILDALRQSNAQLTEALARSRDAAAATAASLTVERDGVRDQLAATTAELTAATERSRILMEDCDHLEAELDALRTQVLRLMSDVSEERKEKEVLGGQLRRVRLARLRELVRRRRRDADLASLTAELGGERAKNQALEQTVAEVSGRMEAYVADSERRGRDQIAYAESLVDLLARERLTVVKPLVRRTLRGVRAAARLLPGVVRKPLRNAAFGIAGLLIPNHPRIRAHRDDRVRERALRQVLAAPPIAQVAASDRFDIIVFPVIDWHFRIQRPQHIAGTLAMRGHRVFYFCTTFFIPDPGEKPYRVIGHPLAGAVLIQLGCPPPHPVIYAGSLNAAQQRFLNDAVEQMRKDFHIGRLASVIHCPFWTDTAVAQRGSLLVYDCIDHHAGFSNISPALLAQEERLLDLADTIVVTSTYLERHLAPRPTVMVRNAADVDFFARPPERLAVATDKPVVGYFGAIAEWFDLDLVIEAATAHPEWTFVMVGATVGCDIETASRLPNIMFTGEQCYADLPGYLHAFDVCLIPFKLTQLTLCTNPVKVYEYLSAGKPVVATAMPELVAIRDQVHIAEAREDFVATLEQAMAERHDTKLAARRANWAKAHSWAKRTEVFEATMLAAFPKVSVIVLCYNKLEFTQGCLSSIEAFSHYPNLEVVVVDNASSDDTASWLTSFAATRPWVKVILNQENLGFAAGNNVGLEAATGDYLVILNNDTYVSVGWLLDLIRPLRDPTIGLVGPVTNNIGNEAKIDIGYNDFTELQDAAFAYTSSHPRALWETGNVAFFCVALSRATYEAVGGLDPAFKVGFFEDDDYCRRVIGAGFKIVIADNVFVHHHLSASFNALGSEAKQRIFEANKAVYEAKWGPWVPHVYRQR